MSTLQRALADWARELDVSIRLGTKVRDFDFERPSVKLENGEELSVDLLVGVDDAWSKCRERYLAAQGNACSPLPFGDLAYRIVLTGGDVGYPELRKWMANPSCQFCFRPD